MAAPTPIFEADRLRTLHALQLLDTEPDPVLDGLVRVAAQALDCPAAAISLVDAERQWFKASLGFTVRETAREHAFCAHAILGDDLLEVSDARADRRFADNPLVVNPEPTRTQPGLPIRFYAGMPISLDGQTLGTLCVIDSMPRTLNEVQRRLLTDLSRAVEHWLLHRHEQLALCERVDALVAQRTEANERAKADAQAASDAKSAFMAMMSHEIRTPMNGVIGAIELLKRTRLSHHQRDLVTTVFGSARSLMTLIDTFLDFSRIEAGHPDVELAPLEVRELLELTCDAMQPLALSRSVQIHLFVDPALPARVLGDAVRLRQIVTNLLGNAIKFCAGLDRPGSVAVRARPVGGSGLSISVADNGIGLSPQAHSRLFQPFVQAEHGTTRRYGGTGLGLAICHRLTLAMGGHISVISLPDQGAQFTVDLPLTALAAAPQPKYDLGGLLCHLEVADAQWAEDWGVYLAAAGAQVTRWHEPMPARAIAPGQPSTVLIRQTAPRGGATPETIGLPAGVACVDLRHGRRRWPRALPGQHIVLDIDRLHSDALLAAVAMAAGRLSEVAIAASADDETLAPTAPDAVNAAVHGRLVLVAEDDETNRLVLEHQFALLGVAAVFANDGLEALREWRAGRAGYCLLLTDLHMPGMDGYELTAAIRSDEAGAQRMPIVALTASAIRSEIEQCKAAGMDDVLAKPIEIDHLGVALRRWCAQGRPPAPSARSAACTGTPG